VHEDIGKKLIEARLIDPTALSKAQHGNNIGTCHAAAGKTPAAQAE